MCLDMFLQILRSLERLCAGRTLVGFQRHMHPDVGGDVISLDCRRPTAAPLAGQLQIASALPANMTFTNMVLPN